MRGRESRWARAAPWRERGGSEREHGVGRVDSTVNEGRFHGGQGGQARRASLEQVDGYFSSKAWFFSMMCLNFRKDTSKNEVSRIF